MSNSSEKLSRHDKKNPDSLFDINTSESGTDSEIIFSKNGHAVICANHDGQRQNFYYTYTTGKGRIFLKGACIIAFDGKTWRKLPGVPEDIGLTLTDSRRPEYVMSGTGGKSGVTYRVSYLEKPKHSFMSYDEDWIVRFCAGGFLDNPQDVWKVTDPDGVKAVNSEGGKETAFGHGDIIIGSPDEKDGRYIAIDYIKGRKLYVEKSGVENLGSKDAVDSYLWEDAKSVINFSKWDSSLRFDEWDEDTAGWFNGWRAGRKSFWILFALLVAAAVLYVLNRIDYDPQSFFPDTLYYATTGVLMALTVVEVWYIISLQRDVLWIVFDVGIIGFLTFPVLALLLVLSGLLVLGGDGQYPVLQVQVDVPLLEAGQVGLQQMDNRLYRNGICNGHDGYRKSPGRPRRLCTADSRRTSDHHKLCQAFQRELFHASVHAAVLSCDIPPFPCLHSFADSRGGGFDRSPV